MKYFSLLILFVLCFVQENLAQTFCHTSQTSSNQQLYSNSLLSAKVAQSYCLKIYIHVIRRTNSTGGQSVTDVNQAIGFLDNDFAAFGISFEQDGSIDYIDDDSFYNAPSQAIFNVNNHNDGIDIYMFNDNAPAGGAANEVGENSEFWISGSYWNSPFSSLVKSHVISHEMGHVLFLWHTFHGTFFEGGDPDQCAELVNGTNSSICGDYIPDTPADPHINHNVTYPACTWTGNGNDANGDPYNPDETQIMAYTNPDCMTQFTNDQGQRMRNAIATLPHLINATVCENCPDNLNVTDDVQPGTNDNQSAEISLTANNNIENSATAVYTAGNNVTLIPGFHAKNGSMLNARIEDCSTGGSSALKSRLLNSDSPNTLASEKMIISPNPAKNELTIDFGYLKDADYQVEIYNESGILVLNQILKEKTKNIDIGLLSRGLYFIILYENGAKKGSGKILMN